MVHRSPRQGTAALADHDLAALWEAHCRHEFETRDVDATMATMVTTPYVNGNELMKHWPRAPANQSSLGPALERRGRIPDHGGGGAEMRLTIANG
jgi:hypothetical protein